MVKNTDIVFEVAHITKNCLFVVGFAAETHDMQKSVRQQLI
ncbi:phosphopantothenoylcysteine decarboxylase [Candidatus Williamhamiltonella defendens]